MADETHGSRPGPRRAVSAGGNMNGSVFGRGLRVLGRWVARLWSRFWSWRAEHPGRIAPAFCTTVAVALGRGWHDHGAAPRIPFVTIGVLIALIVTGVGAVCALGESEAVAGYVLAVAGAVWVFAIVGYGDSLWVDGGIWFGATALAYIVAARNWRAERLLRLQLANNVEVATVAAQAEVAVAEVTASATVRAAEVQAAATVHAAALTAGNLDPYAQAVLVASWADKAELEPAAVAAIQMTGVLPKAPVGAARLRQLRTAEARTEPPAAIGAGGADMVPAEDVIAQADAAWAHRQAERTVG